MNVCPNRCTWLGFHGIATSPTIGWVRWSRCTICKTYVGQRDNGTILTQMEVPTEGLPRAGNNTAP